MPATDAIALLRDDHRLVKELFKDFRKAGPRAKSSRRRLADKIIRELSIHAGIEETVFYPRVRAVVKADDEILEALEEHHIVKTTCSELERMDASDERFGAKMAVLMENVEHHIREEEQELFATVRKEFSRSELVEMGDEMRAAKRVVPPRPHPHAPDEPPANLAASALTTPVDAAVTGVRQVVKRTRRAVAGVVQDPTG